MKLTYWLTAACVLASAAPAIAQTAPAPAAAAPATTVTLSPPNKQGAAGSASVAQQGGDVVIAVRGLADQTTAALIEGSCNNSAKPAVTGPAQALKPLVNGSSQTIVSNTTIAQLEAKPHAIVVQGGSSPTLCGDLGSALSTAPVRPPR